jgi:hypothetical protein
MLASKPVNYLQINTRISYFAQAIGTKIVFG